MDEKHVRLDTIISHRNISRRTALSIMGTGALALAGVGLLGCSNQSNASSSAASTTGASDNASVTKVAGQRWIDSDLLGCATTATATSATDDFALFANKDWIAAFDRSKDGSNIADRAQKIVSDRLLPLLASGSDDSHEGQLAAQLYKDAIDMDARNACGVEPVRAYVDAIRSISSMDEMNAFVSQDNLPIEPFVTFVWLADQQDATK